MTSIPFLSNVKRLLLLGAHADDIEIGAGATLLRALDANPLVEIMWCVFSTLGVRRAEAEASAAAFVGTSARITTFYGPFRDGFFPAQHGEIKEQCEKFKSFSPDLVLTHQRDDRHQDHRVISDLAWNTFRSNQIWEYEIPKWDGDFCQPNLYVPALDAHAARKVELLMTHFSSQRTRHWYDGETFRGLMRLRGLECNAKYAEAFIARKTVVT